MKRYVTLSGFVLLGFVSSLAASFLFQWLRGSEPGPPEESFSLLSPQSQFSFVFTSILSLVTGGTISGYLCSQDVKTKLGFVWITPGFYLLLFYVEISTDLADEKVSPGQFEIMLFGVLTFFVSWAGVGLGHYLRCEILKERQKDSFGRHAGGAILTNTDALNRKLPWFEYSLRTLLVFVALFAVVFGWVGLKMWQVIGERDAAAAIGKLGGKVIWSDTTGRVAVVNLSNTRVTDSDLQVLEGLPRLHQLCLDNTDVTDAGLKHLKGMRDLYCVNLHHTKVTNEGVRKLYQALPYVDVEY